MPNPFVHIELTTDALPSAKRFYKSLFAWKLNEMPAMGYTTIDAGKGGTGGGMQAKPMPEAPVAWLPYVEVADVKATMAKVVAGGGKAILPFQDIGEMGSIGIFADPQGAMLGIYASAPKKAAPKKRAAARKPAGKKLAGKPKTASKKKR